MTESNMQNDQSKIFLLNSFIDRIEKFNIPKKDCEFMKDALKTQLSPFCIFCEGYGHVHKRCTTKRKVKNMLRRAGYADLWPVISRLFQKRNLSECT